MPPFAAQDDGSAGWRAFPVAFAATAVVLAIGLYGFVLWLDPYGRRVGPGRPTVPIMDVNQRYMYPQLARSGLFDSAVFGTSTARLLDPLALDAALGGRFANLAINAGTPWEQIELAKLFLRHVPTPRTIILGLDRAWCEPLSDHPKLRLTFRAFPPWLYDDEPLNDLPELLNQRSLEIAGRVALHRLGLMPARIRGDGYEVFTPPESRYDLARVRVHLARDTGPGVMGTQPRPRRFPAVDWLAELIRATPAATRFVLLFPPLHVSALPRGDVETADEEACKSRIVAAAGGRSAVALDYRRHSGLTAEDSNFWDKLHYRLPIAARIVGDIATALRHEPPPADERYVELSGP